MALYSASDARKVTTKLSNEAGSWVGTALRPALDYVLTIGENNPPAKVRKRKDVQAALAHAASAGEAKALPLVREAWKQGRAVGIDHANAMVAGLGLPDIAAPDIDEAVLVSLLEDVAKIMAHSPTDVLDSYANAGTDGLAKAQRRTAYRVALAVDAAFTHAVSAATVAALKDSGTLKKWVTHSAVPCSHCVHLSLLPPIPWDQEFPDSVPGLPILKVYAKKFLSPPRHPNCACSLKAVRG